LIDRIALSNTQKWALQQQRKNVNEGAELNFCPIVSSAGRCPGHGGRNMQDEKVGTAMALLAALGIAFGAAQATAQETAGCDENSNGYVSADEAATCAEHGYSTIVGSEEAITRNRFEQAFAETENVDEMWTEADADQDGVLSQAEWSDWSARRFRSASPRVEGLSVDDYEALEAQYHMGDDQQGQDESGNGGQSANPGAGDSDPGDSGGETNGSDTGSDDNASSSESGAGGDSGDSGSSGESGGSGSSGGGSGSGSGG
jgi:hypothetical protein